MAETKSNLFPSGLRKYIQVGTQKVNLELQVPRLNILFGQPNKYSNAEKKDWWKEKSDKPFKVGLIKSKELDTRVNIFGEVFDFSKTANRKGNSIEVNVKEDNTSKVYDAGFNTSENVIVDEVSPPESYYTSKDFDKMYLGWLEGESDEKARRSTLKQLFRFIFGNQKIKDVNKFHTKLLVAYTSFTPNEKVPCESKLRNDFREALEFRRTSVMKEIRATKKVIGEQTMYMEQKRDILMGIRDMLNTMDTKEDECFKYGNDPTMKEEVEVKNLKLEDRSSTFQDDDMIRLVRIFQAYVNQMDKYKGKDTSVQGKELYEELRKLLELSNKSGSDLANEEELEEMTEMVQHLSFLLSAYADLHDIHIQLKDIQLELQKEKAEEILQKATHLEERLKPFVSGLTEGGSEVSQLLFRFSQSLLQQTQEDTETLRREILGKFDTQSERIRELDAEKATLQTQLQDIQGQLQKSSSDIKKKEDEVKTIEENLRTNLERLNVIGTQATQSLEEKDGKIKTLQENIVKLEKEKKDFEDEMISLQKLHQSLEEEKQKIEKQYESLQTDLTQLTTDLAKTKKSSEKFTRKYDKQKENHSELTDKYEELKKQKEYLESVIQGRQIQTQGGGGELSKKATCETMLSLLLFHIKDGNMDVQEFLDKAGATLDDLGQCPIVLHVLNEMLDEANDMNSKEGKIVYSPVKSQTANDVLESIENALQGRFTEDEQELLAKLSQPIHFFSRPPEAHEHSMGTRAYMLNDNTDNDMDENDKDEIELEGLVDDTIHLTKEEREAIETGGISLGAITFLYLTCLAEIQSRNETPTSSSKCLLLPKRSPERAKTPKQSHKRQVRK
jgi:myosin heavy subunit